MNWLDIVLIILLVIPAFIGLRQGLIRAVLSLAGMTLGVFLAGRYYGNVAGALGFISNEKLADVLAFILILAAVLAVTFLISLLLRKAMQAVMLGIFDAIGGGIFGFLSGFIFLSAMLALWVKFAGNDSIDGSFVARTMLDYFPLVLGLLPGDFGNAIRNFFE